MSGVGPDTVTLRLATRGSALALWQADHVTALLMAVAQRQGLSLEVQKVMDDYAAESAAREDKLLRQFQSSTVLNSNADFL